MSDPVKSLSDAIIEPITKAYRVGGFGLSFLLLGAFMIFAAALFSTGVFSYPLAFAGLLLVLIPCYFFYTKEIRPISRAQKSLMRSGEMIDAVQQTAIEVTELALSLQALAFKHADQIVRVLEIARPQISAIPVIGKIIDRPLLSEADELARSIVEGTQRIQEAVGNVQDALIYSDAKRLRGYLQDLERLKKQVTTLLALPILRSGG